MMRTLTELMRLRVVTDAINGELPDGWVIRRKVF